MNNPPAFPTPIIVPEGQFTTLSNDGMTLRDYFAAAALQQVLYCWTQHGNEWDGREDSPAHAAYLLADAMLKAREQ